MRTQFKNSFLLLSAFFIIILSFSGYVYYTVSTYSHDDFYKLLEIRAVIAAKVDLEGSRRFASGEFADLREEYFEKLPHEEDYFFPVVSSHDYYKEAEAVGLPVAFFEQVLREGKARYNDRKLFYKGIKYESAEGTYIVIASAQNNFVMDYAIYLKNALFFAIVAAIGFSALIAFYYSRYVFTPLSIITEKVRQISSENLKLRLNVTSRNDELVTLSLTFNEMLDRIETAFETQNNFISNASHELRTPLTAIIGEADVALAKKRSAEDYIQSLEGILLQAERLDRKTKALLFLAQTGFDGKIQKMDKVRIDELLWDVKETIDRLNAKNKIHLDMSLLPEEPKKLNIKGNDQLLHLAFTNIVNNACKYSDYQVVKVSIGATDKHVLIIIKDSGIGIPENELKYIYDPFFRASNTNNYEGYGIGLPLSLNIIRMHKGEILVSSILGEGTTVQIKLPVLEI